MANYVDKFEIDNQEILIRDSEAINLWNKKMIVLGDSLTIGDNSQGTLGKTWVELIGAKYNMDYYNYGVSGSKIAQGTSPNANDMCTRIDTILSQHSSCDIFVVMGGANDKNSSVKTGSINSVSNTEFIGAIKNIIAKIRRKYKQNCKLVFMTTYHRYDSLNNIGLGEEDYVVAMTQACNLLSVPCFNNYNNCGITLADTQYTTNEPYAWADSGRAQGLSATYHFSVNGYKYLAKIYEQFLQNCYVNNEGVRYEQINVSNSTTGDEVWTKQKLPNGMTLVTLRKLLKDATFTQLSDSTFWVSQLYDITPPQNLFTGYNNILSVNVNVQGNLYPSAHIHALSLTQMRVYVSKNWATQPPVIASLPLYATFILI